MLLQVQVLPSEKRQKEADGQTAVAHSCSPVSRRQRGAGGLAATFICGRSDHSCFCHSCLSLGPENKGTPWAQQSLCLMERGEGYCIHRRGPCSSWPLSGSENQARWHCGKCQIAEVVGEPAEQSKGRGERAPDSPPLFSAELSSLKTTSPEQGSGEPQTVFRQTAVSPFASGGFRSVLPS